MDNHKKAIETAVELVKNGKISREAAEKIFPELRESEDERIRKSLIGLVEQFMADERKEKTLAWLEKQKEQKPADISDLRDWKFIVDAVLTEHEGIGQYLDKPETERIAKKLQGRFSLPQSKSVEWSEEDKLWLSEVYFAIDHSMYSEIERQAMKKYIDYLRYQSQPKPAEWSEEDKLHYANILEALEYVKGCKSDYDKIEALKSDIAWLKSRRYQPKQEWSEEDEKIRKALVAFLEMDTGYFACDGFTKDDIIQWLKSPRPQPKAEWSKEDEDMLSAIEYCVKTKRALAEEHYKWIEEKLKSIRPYWIPTDKQMESIRYLLEDYAPWTTSSREARQDLRAVYNELLKYKEK
jgi:polyhydroxyalkanoate synthesis regulator phasin